MFKRNKERKRKRVESVNRRGEERDKKKDTRKD
jgi:hypothetical protein